MANFRLQLYAYKGNRCSACGKTVQQIFDKYGTVHRLFEFNHIDPSQKHPKYENLIRRVLSTEQLDEVDKCVLLCDRCHNVVHAQKINADLSITMHAGNRSCEQKFKGQMLFDFGERTATFLTNERALFIPYIVQLGSRKPVIKFGRELDEGLLMQYLKNIQRHKSVIIRSVERARLLEVHAVSDDEVDVMTRVEFTIPKIELGPPVGRNELRVWVRNGMALASDGRVIDSGSVRFRAKVNPEFIEPLTHPDRTAPSSG